jgi:pimeloyl-ACP methyl ester carboxylesterase
MAKHKTFLFAIPLAVASAGAATVAARYRREMRAARERLDSLGSQVINTDYGPIEYVRSGEGYPVLAVHGALGGVDQGLMVAGPMLDPGFQVISVSRFGHLRSPLPPNASLDLQADAYASLLHALGIEQAVVFGVSAGATTSIRFTARYPERVSALVLFSPAAPGQVIPTTPPRAVFETLLRNDFLYWASITYLRQWLQSVIGVPKGFALTRQMMAEVKAVLAQTLPASERADGFIFEMYSPEWGAEFYQSVTDTSPYPLSAIKTPVLVINALDDPLSIPENVHALAEKIPNARLFVVPDGGHQLLGHAQEARSEIARFLRANVPVPKSST